MLLFHEVIDAVKVSCFFDSSCICCIFGRGNFAIGGFWMNGRHQRQN